jgi:hypothetical protein
MPSSGFGMKKLEALKGHCYLTFDLQRTQLNFLLSSLVVMPLWTGSENYHS